MGNILYFGGADDKNGQRTPPVNIDSLNAWQFCSDLDHWVGKVWAVGSDAPLRQEELAAFDKIRLIPQFRVDYAAGRISCRHGWTLEEGFLAAQLLLHQRVDVLIVRKYADQPSGRISRKRYLESDELSLLLVHNLKNWEAAQVEALVTDGHFAHSIVVTGASPDGQSIRYMDPWPGTSLLCRDQNAAGVNARPGDRQQDGWIVDLDEFARVLVAVYVPESYVRFWQDQIAHRTESITPIDPVAQWDGWRPTDIDAALASRIAVLSCNPGSREALASAALALAVATRERNLKEESLHWLRQAAYAGDMLVAEALQKRLVSSDQQHDDPAEWLQTLTRQAALSGATEIGKTFANLPEPSRDYWKHRQRQLEGDYWARQVTLAQDTKNPWAIETDTTVDGADPWALQQYQMVAPLQNNELDVAREFAARGDLESARRAYERVISTRHPTSAPEAAYELGVALLESDHPADAADCFRIATLSCHLDVGPWAANMMGIALEKTEEVDDAVAAYERAIYSGHLGACLTSNINLGHLYFRRGKPLQALDAYMQAAISDHSTYSPPGYLYAGLIYLDIKDLSRAKALFEQVVRFPESEYAKEARDQLVELGEV